MYSREASNQYSSVFSIVVPSTSPISDWKSERPLPSPLGPYLSHLHSLFPPPPFTPTHPVFKHLASFAVQHSAKLRQEAEAQINIFVKEKAKEVLNAEEGLRRQVEVLWVKFKEGAEKAEQERQPTSPRSPVSRQRELSTFSETAGTSSPKYGTPQPVRNFVPLEVPPTRSASATPATRVSSLSASLATSSFHHPKAKRSPPHSPAHSELSNGSHSPTSSLYPASSITLAPRPGGSTDANVLQFRRNAKDADAINANASYKYFMNLEEERARHKRAQEKIAAKKPERVEEKPILNVDSSSPKLLTNGKKPDQKKDPPEPAISKDTPNADNVASGSSKAREEKPTSPNNKGKRKVTFNIQPAIATINTEDARDTRPTSDTAGTVEPV